MSNDKGYLTGWWKQDRRSQDQLEVRRSPYEAGQGLERLGELSPM